MAADAITRSITSIQSDALTQVDLLLNDVVIYGILLLVLLLIGEKRNEKRSKVIAAMGIALVLGLIVNVGMGIERPCVENGSVCPMLYSFPSIHATLAFILMISFLENKWFPFYLLFALFVSFSRIHLEVHVFRDIVGGLIIALLAYNITYLVWRRWKHE